MPSVNPDFLSLNPINSLRANLKNVAINISFFRKMLYLKLRSHDCFLNFLDSRNNFLGMTKWYFILSSKCYNVLIIGIYQLKDSSFLMKKDEVNNVYTGQLYLF